MFTILPYMCAIDELNNNIPYSGSWHQKYQNSAWCFIGGLSFELTEGDIVCVMSQFGEVDDINLIREEKTGKSKGFCFLKYHDTMSTVLAVDNLNGYELLSRMLRVDHVEKYRLPKHIQDKYNSDSDDSSDHDKYGGKNNPPRGLPGHAYEEQELENEHNIHDGIDVFAVPVDKGLKKKAKKQKKKHKSKKRKVDHQEVKHRDTRDVAEVNRENKRLESSAKNEHAVPSASGWRGRHEPKMEQRGRQEDENYEMRQIRKQKSFGGMYRTR